MSSKLRRLALLPLLIACHGPAAAGGETVAVLSSVSGAYLEAFSAFQAAYGAEVPHFDISGGKPVIPPGTSTVVAFGGKAANYQFPPGAAVVYCMAPGFFFKTPHQGRRAVKISLIPEFSAIFSRLKEIQPGLKRLRVFWMTPPFGPYADPAIAEGARQGIEITPVKVSSHEDLPSLLRQALGNADAYWVPPDPLLVTPESLMIMREFSWANSMPFYGSTKGMTREGAAASVGVSFENMGAAAALAAKQLYSGIKTPELLFPEKTEVTINATSAKKCRLELTPAILNRADYLFP